MSARDVLAKAFGGDYDSADLTLAALDAAGYAVVPKVPTKAMIFAANQTMLDAEGTWNEMIEAVKEKP